MGVTLLNSNPIFQRAITACAAVVKPFGIDLLAEFHAEKGWKTPVLASVGLIAVQIGLVDILREEYGIVPDGMLGHSAGLPLLECYCQKILRQAICAKIFIFEHLHGNAL